MGSRVQGPLRSPSLDLTAPFSLRHLVDMPPTASPSPAPELNQDDLKRIAAHHAVDLVQSGMIVGLGTGSTAAHALDRIGDLIRRGVLRDIVGIPTSKKTEVHARAVGIPLSDLDTHPVVDLSIDGADEVDRHLNLVKGRGGSLLREKMIEGASKRFVVIVDESKMVNLLGGSGLAVPVEIIPFCWKFTMGKLRRLFDGVPGFDLRLRTTSGAESTPSVTDNLNYVIDLFFENGISGDLDEISDAILKLWVVWGVVEHGMFLGMTTSVIVAGKDGSVTVINRVGDRSMVTG
ncbi:LOW QUALITY PROTEIN: probable ribose-5-phosphate isomerase 1 [Phalaenopsis equestris]|uniref:LOW QUALITY PROTEIN: probable ribose-5-phosphate isomerase 1 n=1 Tax=Phalaenopsis equestris TaxID=78828 RepID=UPI0009E64451|nr:LOW QUALITY PROTEIN: probable ribose-5-phosphate isomerase 1 [Phalaenopsis equestris]